MAFLSSPSGSAQRRSHFFASSSPALPSVQEILSQASKNPPFRLGNKMAAVPNDANTQGTDTSRQSEVQQPRAAPKASKVKGTVALDIGDTSVSVVEISADSDPKARKPRPKKDAPAKRRAPPKQTTNDASPTKDQPRKKAKSKRGTDKKTKDAGEQDEVAGTAPIGREMDSKSAQSTGSPVPKATRKPAKVKRDDTNEPLQLEPATIRRLDWTPPSLKAPIVLDSDSPTPGEPDFSTGAGEAAKSFELLLESYKCKDNARQDVATISDEDSSFLRKRKLIELVPTTAPNAPAAQVPEKSPMKQKAPKKKPRTITELATAAYRAPPPLESAPATASLANKSTDVESDKAVDKGKSKAKPRKRASKAKKKPSPPPKPVLLPPTEALKEVSNQDFIFGTSSQLAVENSPTFLRHLQTAMKQSNQLDSIDFETPLNSDAIEPPEQKPKMWGAGTRDAEGDLFDLEVIKITEGSPQCLKPPQEDDHFGYVRVGEDSVAPVSNTHPNGSQDDDPFADLSDKSHSPDIKPLEIIDDDDPFSDSQIFTGSPVWKHIKPPTVSAPKESAGTDSRPAKTDRPDLSHEVESQLGPPQPSYELYTDAQLSKEVTSYGFKVVKSRKAKIALLEQCWQSKVRTGQGTVSTTATISTVASQGTTEQGIVTTPGKRPRGRPRKSSNVSLPEALSEAQEPPPSAQPPESPKRPRGRQKKDTTTKPATKASIPKTNKSSTRAPEVPTTPKRKPKSTKVVIEIPDSASECESNSSTTPRSSPEPTFSPGPTVDLAMSINDDTDPTLVLDSGDDQSGLFNYITKAITSAPRTTDPSNPSWHEKILLFDPIVLEDLTAWLNCGPLTRAGFDGEANTGEVKKWCESKSVCCLWKVNFARERKKAPLIVT